MVTGEFEYGDIFNGPEDNPDEYSAQVYFLGFNLSEHT